MKCAKAQLRLFYKILSMQMALTTIFTAIVSCSGGGDGTPTTEPEPLDPISLLASAGSGITGANPHISADGRYVVFESGDTDLVDNDINTNSDVFRYDTQTGEIIRVSVKSDGSGPNEPSYYPRITEDGRYVLFLSDANDLFPGNTDFLEDVYVRDTVAGTTALVSVNTNGDKADGRCQQADISSDGTLVTFSCDSTAGFDPADNNSYADVFLRDLINNTTKLVTYRDGQVLDGDSIFPVISGNGRFIVFTSWATNLVDGDNNAADDVFLYDIQTDQLELISKNTAGDLAMGESGGAAISYDGSVVSFYSNATNLTDPNTDGVSYYAYIRNRTTNTTTLVSVDDQDTPLAVSNFPPTTLSANGQFIVFQSFESGGTHIRVRDLQNNTTELLDKNTLGEVADPPESSHPIISGDGRYMVFLSNSTNLVEGYVLDGDYFYKAPNLLY